MIKELLRCPFECGSQDDHAEYPPEVVYDEKYNKYHVECGYCSLASPDENTEKEAIDYWNKRTMINLTSEYWFGYNKAKRDILDLITETLE